MHQNPVGAHTGLPGIPVFRGNRALDRHLDIGVIKDDKRRITGKSG